MTDPLIIIDSDGNKTPLRHDAAIHFSLEDLSVTINSPSLAAGWHWDSFVAIIIPSRQKSRDSQVACDISLQLNEEKALALRLPGFLEHEVNPAHRVLKLTGQEETIYINLDFLHYFATEQK